MLLFIESPPKAKVILDKTCILMSELIVLAVKVTKVKPSFHAIPMGILNMRFPGRTISKFLV